jgi:hypothetical protein
MRTLAALILLALLVSPAFAFLPHPYIGALLQENVPSGSFSKSNLSDMQGAAKSSLGGELQLGIIESHGSLYLAYRIARMDAKGTDQVHNSLSGKWNLDRWSLGARFNILNSLPLPVHPLLGAGLTYGRADAGSLADMMNTRSGAGALAKQSLGWFAEAGAIVNIPMSLHILGSVQYHNYNAKFESGSAFGSGTIKVSYWTVQAGLLLDIF